MSTLRFISWNVNGIRAQLNKGFSDFILKNNSDFFLFQETKADVKTVKDIGNQFPGYFVYAAEADKKGYSGTAVFSKIKAINEVYKIQIDEHDGEGRINALEFPNFWLVNVYVPNSGSEMKRLDYRKSWDEDFLQFCLSLNSKKPVIIGGDFNVAHQAIDLARPKENYNKTSGYTQTEIDGFDHFVQAGFVDSFRVLNPDKIAYTFWNQRFKARERNVGWRIDYFLVSDLLKNKISSAAIHDDVPGSDHCPLSLTMDI